MVKRSGFTLIELLVVMAIIATLLSIAVPRFFDSIKRSEEATLRQNLATTREAIDKYFADRSSYPDAIADLVSKRYLRALPVDPMTGSALTWIEVAPPPAERGKVYDVKSGAEGVGRDGTPYSTW